MLQYCLEAAWKNFCVSRVRELQAREAAQSSARLEEDGAVDQSVTVSELPED